jgi:hypothetical protein
MHHNIAISSANNWDLCVHSQKHFRNEW